MLYKKLSVIILCFLLSSTQISPLGKGEALGISLVSGALFGVAAEVIASNNSRHFRSSDGVIAGLTTGSITALLSYWILYHSCVNEGPCSLCGERSNSWEHAYDAQVKANCGHKFGYNCISGFIAKNGSRCPICAASIYNLFEEPKPVVVVQQPVVVVPVYSESYVPSTHIYI